MPRTCTVCTHAERIEIDQALLTGEPFRNIAKRYGTSPTALFRHKQADIPATLAKTKQAQEEVRAETLFERLRVINRETKAILEEARVSGSLSIALAAINRVERQLELEARLLGQLNDSAKVAVGINVNAARPEFDFTGWSNEQLAQRAEQLAARLRNLRPGTQSHPAGDSGDS